MEIGGCQPETLMETRTTFRLVSQIFIHLGHLTTVNMDGHNGQILLVVPQKNNHVKLFAPYLLITQLH